MKVIPPGDMAGDPMGQPGYGPPPGDWGGDPMGEPPGEMAVDQGFPMGEPGQGMEICRGYSR